MIVKSAALLLCSQAIFVMANWQGQGCCGCGDSYNGDNGGLTFEVVSSSKPPTGLTVVSDNAYEGCLEIGGKVPFVASTDVQAETPTDGCSKVCYGCGCGQVSINREGGCSGAAGLRGCDGGAGCYSGGNGCCAGGSGCCTAGNGYNAGSGCSVVNSGCCVGSSGCCAKNSGYCAGNSGCCARNSGCCSGGNGWGWSVAV